MVYNPYQKHVAPLWCRLVEPLEVAPDNARAAGIRRIFEVDFAGRAELEAVSEAARRAGLLEGIHTADSARNVVRAALRPIARPTGPW